MRKLLDFLLRKKHWFLFILFEALSVALIYRNNSYQRSVILSSANFVSGYVISLSGEIQSYFNLREINRKLQEQNGQMELKILELQEQIETMQADTVTFKGAVTDSVIPPFPYQFIAAEVVNNSIAHFSNYITINKGKNDGIKPDMGVVCESGVVGIVSNVSEHFSVIIPLLNPKSKISCKILGNNNFGYLSWDGDDASFATLQEVPRHSEFQKGDTIITSGYSAIFPPGLIVGTIEDFDKEHDDNFYALRIKLAASFTRLRHVQVIKNALQEEQINLEKEAKKND